MSKIATLLQKDGFADFENLSLHNSDNFDEKEEDLKDNDSVGFFSTLWDLTKNHQVVRYILKYCKGYKYILSIHQETDDEVLEVQVGPHFRVEFNGELDIDGNGFGKVTRYNTKKGLEEASVEGNWIQGLLQGKVR